MATNVKHKDSNKYNKALTLDDRIAIDSFISKNRDGSGKMTITLNEIAAVCAKNKTSTKSNNIQSLKGECTDFENYLCPHLKNFLGSVMEVRKEVYVLVQNRIIVHQTLNKIIKIY